MWPHSNTAVNKNSQVANSCWRQHVVLSDTNISRCRMILVKCGQTSENLCRHRVQLMRFVRSQSRHFIQASWQGGLELAGRPKVARALDLGIEGIQMWVKTVSLNEVYQISSVQDEHQGCSTDPCGTPNWTISGVDKWNCIRHTPPCASSKTETSPMQHHRRRPWSHVSKISWLWPKV